MGPKPSASLPGRSPLAAVTATLQDGAPLQSVCSFLRLQHGHYHFIRRSNSRPDIRLIFRTVKSGLSSATFPELHWVVKSKGRRRILIFARTISLGFRTMIDFWSLLSNDPSRAKRIRLFNAVTYRSYSDQTIALWQSNGSDAQIIIATSILRVGIDAPAFDDAIVYGEPPDSDESVQDYGDSSNMVASKPVSLGRAASGGYMRPSTAKLILASCKVTQLDETKP